MARFGRRRARGRPGCAWIAFWSACLNVSPVQPAPCRIGRLERRRLSLGGPVGAGQDDRL